MQVTVKFFSFEKLAGTRESNLQLPPGATVDDVVRRLAEQFPRIFPAANSAIYLLNQRTAARDLPLHDGDQILMLQVIAGG